MRISILWQEGFTLAEVLVVMSLMTIIAGFALVVSFGDYRGDSLRVERAALVAALQHARAEAVDGICSGENCTQAEAHGVAVQNDAYVIFQGETFASRDAGQDDPVGADPNIIHGDASEISFAPFSGDAVEDGAITLTDAAGNVATVTVGSQGQILWSN